MTKPHRAGNAPAEVDLVAGRNYSFCTCGRSASQPFCDGSHRGTEFSPHIFRAEKTEKAWLCMCKCTGNRPFCDGSHGKSE